MKVLCLALSALLLSPNIADARSMVVSWYGNHWAGRTTANGERFNPHKFTAASKTLPMGTRLLLMHGRNHVIVRINDRGPYIHGRSLDITERAARVLKIHDRGVSKVNYKILSK